MDYTSISEKNYNDLASEKERLEKKYNDTEADCLKENLTFAEFCDKVHDIKEKIFFIDKFMRLKEDPVLTYGKEWSGKLYELNEFKEMCDEQHQALTDEDGIGYYATETAKSSIIIKPSDFAYDMVRTDFTHVLWFNK